MALCLGAATFSGPLRHVSRIPHGGCLRLLAVLLLLTTGACGRDKVVVTIENTGAELLSSVSLWSGTYTSYVGNLASGQVVTDTLLAEGESITMEHGANPRTRLVIIGYFIAGRLDSVRAQVRSDSVLKVQQW